LDESNLATEERRITLLLNVILELEEKQEKDDERAR